MILPANLFFPTILIIIGVVYFAIPDLFQRLSRRKSALVLQSGRKPNVRFMRMLGLACIVIGVIIVLTRI